MPISSHAGLICNILSLFAKADKGQNWPKSLFATKIKNIHILYYNYYWTPIGYRVRIILHTLWDCKNGDCTQAEYLKFYRND